MHVSKGLQPALESISALGGEAKGTSDSAMHAEKLFLLPLPRLAAGQFVPRFLGRNCLLMRRAIY